MKNELRKRLLEGRQKSRRRSRARKLFFRGILCALIVGFFSFLIFSTRFKIRAIELHGLKRVPEKAVADFIKEQLSEKKYFVLPGDNIFLMRPGILERNLLVSFPVIQTASVRRIFFHTLYVALGEYNAWGVLCREASGDCYWIDRSGVAFEHAPEVSGIVVPKVTDNRVHDFRLGEKYLSTDFMHLVAYFDERARQDDAVQSVEFSIDKKDSTLRLKTRAGWEILLLENVNAENAYKNLKVTLGEVKDKVASLEYVDLRFGNKVFYKFR